ncbi:MAG TPA: protein kinase [Prosthecobacter sp.]
MSHPPPHHCPQCGAATSDKPEGLCPRCLMAQVMQPTQTGDATATMPPFKPEDIAPHFPQLEVLECLGRGGMGVVYKARQKSLNRLVALKLLAPERADDPQFAARFEKEAQALAALNHPHIVGVHDFGQAGGFYYLLMEFVDGVNLRQLLQTKRLTPKEALSIVPPVCEALQCAHDHGIVHRDIKPENLLIDKAGKVKIADFGVAKMLGVSHFASFQSPASQPFGTPDYAAPEQYNGGADHRADIYSLGVVLYEMLTGERPKDKIEAPSKRVQVDIRIDEIVLRALEKTPELRFATAAEFRTQVEAATLPQDVAVTDLSSFTADPKNWYWHLFYFCREDLRIVVPKRINGLGWTLNMARPMALPFIVLVGGVMWGAYKYLWWRGASRNTLMVTSIVLVLGLAALCHKMANPLRRVRSPGRPPSLARRHLLLPACVLVGMYVALVTFVYGTLNRLPKKVATHFDLQGRANGWESREWNAWFTGLFPLGFYAFFALIVWLTWRLPKVMPLNVPRRDHWTRPEHRAEAALIMGGGMLWFCCIMTAFFGAIHWLMLDANRVSPPYSAPGTLIPVVVGLFALLLVWIAGFMYRYANVTTTPSGDSPGASRRAMIIAGVVVVAVVLGDVFLLPRYLQAQSLQTEAAYREKLNVLARHERTVQRLLEIETQALQRSQKQLVEQTKQALARAQDKLAQMRTKTSNSKPDDSSIPSIEQQVDAMEKETARLDAVLKSMPGTDKKK